MTKGVTNHSIVLYPSAFEPSGKVTPPRNVNTENGVRVSIRRSLPLPKPIMQDVMAERVRKLLERCALFRALDERERDDLAAHAQVRKFAANEPIFHVGDPGHCVMGVVLGTVRISLPAPKGREVILADLLAGEFFGEIALIDGKPRSGKCYCAHQLRTRGTGTPGRAAVSGTQSDGLSEPHATPLQAGFAAPNERMAEIAFFDLPARLARALLRYPVKGHGPHKLCLSQRELAEMSGATRENVNRCLREWQRRGILELKNRSNFTILKPEALSALEENS